MASLTDTAEDRTLDWINGVGTPTRPTTPLKVRLMTANGSDSAAGTELATGGGYTAGGANIVFTAASGGASENNAAISWTNMPAATITGIEIWDSAGTPVRLWWGALSGGSKTVAAGDTFTFAAGAIDTTQT